MQHVKVVSQTVIEIKSFYYKQTNLCRSRKKFRINSYYILTNFTPANNALKYSSWIMECPEYEPFRRAKSSRLIESYDCYD